MPGFDPNEYFNRRSSEFEAMDRLVSPVDKLAELQDASIRARAALMQRGEELRSQELAAKSSLVGRLGLNPNGLTGETVNLLESAASGTSHMVGDVVGFGASAIPAWWNDAKLDEDQKAMVARYLNGQATPEEKVAVNTRIGDDTPLQIYQKAVAARMRGENIDESFDISRNVHQGNRDQLHAELGQTFADNWDKISGGASKLFTTQGDQHLQGAADFTTGLAKLIYQTGDVAVHNKTAAAEYIAENLPQLAVGGAGKLGQAGMALANISYATEYYQKGIQEYQAKNQGQYPSDAERTKMALVAASLAAAEHVGSLVELKAAKGAADALEETGKHGLLQSVVHTAKAALEGGAEETATEGYQSWGEGYASQKPATIEDIYEGGVIGGLAGAGMSGGGRAVGELTKTTPEHAEEQAKQATRAQAQVEAVKTGDVSALVDPKAPTYDPAAAVAALHGHASLDTTTPEVRQAKLEEAGKIVAELQAKRDKLQEVYDSGTPETLAQAQQLLDTHTARMAAIDPADTAAVQAQQDNIDMAQGMVNDVKVAPPAELKRQKAQIDKLDANLTQANEYMGRFQKDTSTKVDEETAVQTLSQPVTESSPEVHAKAAETVINLSMASPDRVNGDTAVALADNKANGLNEGQRTYLREYAAARNLDGQLQDMKAVDQQVYAGGNGNVGIAQYRSRIAAALATGNQAQADQQLAQLAKFQASHEAKAAVFAQALQQGLGTTTVQTKDGQWQIEDPAKPIPEARVKQRKVINSRAWVNAVQTEAKAIAATHQEMSSAYALKFSNAQQGAAHVQVVPQAHGQATNQPAVHPAPQGAASVAAPAAGPAVTAGAGHVAGPAVVADPQLTPAVSSTAVDQASHDAVTAGRDEGQNQSKNSTETAPSQSEELAGEGRTSPESAEQTSDHEGKLAVMGRQSPEGTAPTARNLIADFFTQTAARAETGTKRALVAAKDFLSTAYNRAAEFAGVTELTDAQHRVLADFKKTATAWASTIQANLSQKANAEFNFEDLMQFLVENTPKGLDLEENLKTAIAYAAYVTVAEMATKSPINTDEEINGILGRDENENVSDEDKKNLGSIGIRQAVVINTMGSKVAQALGLSTKSDAYQDLQPRLHAALGAHVMALLVSEGLLERNTILAPKMAQLRGEPLDPKHADAKFFFLKPVRDVKGTQSILEAIRGSGSILDKVFGAEEGLKDPEFDPKAIQPQKGIRNTRQKIPAKLAKIIAHENAQPNHLRLNMWLLAEALGDQAMLKIAGWVEPSTETMHKANRDAQKAKNDGLERELANFRDFVTEVWAAKGLELPIFFQHVVWKQQRVGIANNTVNPQTSKIHRHLLTRPNWETEVDPLDPEQRDNFRLRVLEGLGTKTDKQSNEQSLAGDGTKSNPGWKAGVENNAKVQAAVAAIKASKTAPLTESQKDAIAAAASSMHALDALMALAEMDPVKPFKTSLMGEVDGVTNGPMLSHMLLGASTTIDRLFARANKGGFFRVGQDQANYNVWRGQTGNSDLYETTARSMTRAVQDLIQAKPGLQKTLDAIYAFTGELVDKSGDVKKEGRNIVKTPLTAFTFGSAESKAVRSMALKFVESIYGRIEDEVAKGREDQAAVILKDINHLLNFGGASPIQAKTLADLMEHEFKPHQVDALVLAFNKTLGQAMTTTLQTEFKDFIERRRTFNQAAGLAFGLHNALYTAMREQYIEELRTKGELPNRTYVDKPGVTQEQVLHDLTKAQEAELRKRLAKVAPMLNTKFSAESGSLASGLAVSKGGRKLSQLATYAQKVGFGRKIDGASSVSVHGYEQREVNPGVAMLPMSVHSLDSYISHTAAMLGQVLNIHDAHGAGVGTFTQTAKNLNQATWQALLEYSPASEMADTLSRTVQAVAEILAQDDLPPKAKENLRAALMEAALKFKDDNINEETVLLHLMADARSLAYHADDLKLQALAEMQSIDQYALEGGQYDVTEEDRTAAEGKRAGLTKGLSKEENAAIDAISAALASSQASSTSIDEQTSEDEEDAPVAVSPFGPVGVPQVASDAALVSLLKGSPTARQVIQHLYAQTKDAAGRTNAFNAQLLRLLAKTVPAGMTVRLVTPTTDPKTLMDTPKEAAHAWFVAQGSKSEINVLSPAFANSGLTTETLLHELTHAALAQAIANPTAETKALIAELDELRQTAKAYAEKQGIKDFTAALDNVQEFVAWGMTNQTFQRQVISQVSMPSKTTGNALVNGMKAFISKLTGILFKGSTKTEQQQAENGLTTLISNVSGLFNQVGTEATAAAGGSLTLSMATNPVGTLNTFSTLDIHAALPGGSISPEFDAHLRGLLGGIVAKLHGTFGSLKESMMANQALTPLDVWTKALATGKAPFASLTQIAPMTISERERHAMEQVEVTVSEALSHNETSTKQAARELKRLYEEMRETVKPTDFNSQDEYDFVFEVAPNAAGFSDHLARFAAFGLANEQFAKIMKSKTTVTTRKVRDGKGFAERFQIIFEKVLEFFHGDLAHSFGGQNAGAKLTQLVDKLVDVEAKRRSTLATPTNLSLFDQAANAVGTKSKQALNSVVNSKWVGGNSNVFIRAAGGLVKIAANQQVMQALDVINDLRDKYTNETHGFLAGWMNDIRGPGQKFNALQLLVTNVQRIRHKLASDMEKFVPKAFANPESLTEKASAAMSKVFLRTGMHFLVREGRMNMVELENVLTNKTARDAAISTLEGELRAVGAAVRNHYINHANALAYYTATGLTIKKTMMLNAHNIARMRDVLGNHVSEAQAKQAEKAIEQLVALYAIDYLDSKDLKEAVKVLHEENARTDAGNGVEFTLKMHDKLIEDARARLFEGQEALMLHGYVPEILNPHTKTQVANAAEGQELRYQGYVYAGPVQNDPADPNQEVRGLYVLRDGGMAQRVTGSMSWSGKNAKGTKQTNGYMNVNSPDGLDNAKLHNKIMAQKMTSTLDTGPRVNLAKVKSRSYMTPIVNAQGQITNWRYMMSAKTRDQVLERTNDFGRLLGALAGSTFDKQTTPQTNAKVVAALKEVWDEQKGTHPRSFVEIGPASQDPELVEIWRMLPDETRAQVRKVFGNGSMYVRKDLVTTVFGYRKASIGDIFEKDATMRNALEKVFVWSLENILGTLGHGAARLAKDPDAKDLALNAAKRAAITAVRGERIWQGIVHEAKDIIVVRSGVVMLNNLKSNTMMLAAEGVRPKAIATGMLVAMRGARDYQAHTEELAELQAKLDTKTAGINKPAVERRIAELHDAIARNPIKEIIDMGLMPTISEDVGQEDPYAFKNFYTQKVDEIKDKVVSHLNPTVVKAVKTAYIAKDTAIYQGLSRITQLSDFAARYVLFKHLTERPNNPLSKADAAFQASEDFINYDVPMHKGMQYMDDMGFLMFIKYFNRMQRVVWRVSKENPGRVLSSVLVHHFAGFIPSVLESSWMTHFGNNPFSGGATQFVGALGELGTVSSVVRLLK